MNWGQHGGTGAFRREAPPELLLKIQEVLDLGLHVEKEGVRGMRRFPGYHDETPQGPAGGKTLSKTESQLPRIYREHASGEIDVITVLEVNKHEY